MAYTFMEDKDMTQKSWRKKIKQQQQQQQKQQHIPQPFQLSLFRSEKNSYEPYLVQWVYTPLTLSAKYNINLPG